MKKPNSLSSASVIRQKAEELMKTKKQKTVLPNSEADILKLIYELEVRQIELELQNEELVRIKSYGDNLNKSLFQDNHSVILYIDAETGNIKKANPAACNYYGWSDADLCKKNISEINILSQAEVVIEMKKAKEEKRNHFFFKHRLASGEIRDVEVYSGPVHDNNSILLYSFIHDITERKLAEETLQNERILLRTVIDNIPDKIYAKDFAGRLTLSNKSDIQMMRATSESEVLGKTDFEFFPKELADAFFADEQLIMQTGLPLINKEEYVVDEKEVTRCLLTSKIPLHDLNGLVVGLVGIVAMLQGANRQKKF
jgi:PAS domain S-box-containing protein